MCWRGVRWRRIAAERYLGRRVSSWKRRLAARLRSHRYMSMGPLCARHDAALACKVESMPSRADVDATTLQDLA